MSKSLLFAVSLIIWMLSVGAIYLGFAITWDATGVGGGGPHGAKGAISEMLFYGGIIGFCASLISCALLALAGLVEIISGKKIAPTDFKTDKLK